MSLKLRFLILMGVIGLVGYFFVTMPLNLGLDLQGGTQLIIQAKEKDGQAVDNDTMLGILSVLRTRIDALGVTEPLLQRKGLDQIVVELPGVKDPERAIALVGETALLEFVPAEWAPRNIEKLSKEKRETLIGKNVTIVPFEERDANGKIIVSRSLILKKAVLTGNDLALAAPGTDNFGRPVVQIGFTPKGADIFYETTRSSIGKPLAILLDGKVISAPNVNAAIGGGKAIIEGNFTIQEMKDLVIKLKAGALPVPVEIISNKIVGPTLGKDSIEKSKKAGIIGFSLICVYMVVFYRFSGLVASVALCFYLISILALLKSLSATLTLPGIAGIILTLGMAVDANVIIFERIRDEMSQGLPPLSSVKEGFSKGFVAILDSNITTLIAAVVLFWLGTGPIKGFSVTFSLGVLTSMFTAVFVTRLFLEFISRQEWVSQSSWFIRGKYGKSDN